MKKLSKGYFNQVTIDKYTPMTGIGKHIDNKHHFDEVIATINLLTSARMEFEKGTHKHTITLARRSGMTIEKEARDQYTHKSHGTSIKTTRIYITARHIKEQTNQKRKRTKHNNPCC